MNAHLFIYEGFVQFEVVLAAYFIASKGKVISVGIDDKPVTSDEEGKKIAGICDGTIHIAKAGVLDGKKFTTSLSLGQYPYFASAEYTDSTVASDGNIITAKANGYVDFALEIGRAMDLYDDRADYEETVRFFRKLKRRLRFQRHPVPGHPQLVFTSASFFIIPPLAI